MESDKHSKLNETKSSNVNLERVLTLFKTGEVDEAIEITQRYLREHPQHPSLHNFLGVCLTRKMQFERAALSFKMAVDLNPTVISHIKNLFLSYHKLGRQSEAEQVLKDADKALNERNCDIKVALGEVMSRKGDINSALEYYNDAQKLDAQNIKLRLLKGLLLEKIYAFEDAENTYIGDDEPLELQLDLRELLANLYGKMGRRSDAINLFKSIINENPSRASAYRNLSKFLNFREEKDFLKEIELAISTETKTTELIDLNFALAKAYDDRNDTEKCFTSLKTANDLQNKISAFNIENERSAFEVIKNKNFPLTLDRSYLGEFPEMVFVVGMPRSGTSLIEQILSRHPQIFAAGEQEIVPTLMAKYGVLNADVSNDTYEKLIADYCSHISLFNSQKRIFLDKLPNNYRWIKFLKFIFPDSRFIYLKRNPIAVCWSNYFHYFKSKGMSYSTNLYDIAEYYQLHEEIMDTWKMQFSEDIFEIEYETFTENYRTGVTDLLNFLHLEPAEECYSHHESDRVVNTASSLQARSKIFTGSSEKWKKYECYLTDLITRFN